MYAAYVKIAVDIALCQPHTAHIDTAKRRNPMTPFMKFWKALNEELAARGAQETTYGPAKFYYQYQFSPRSAAEDLAD